MKSHSILFLSLIAVLFLPAVPAPDSAVVSAPPGGSGMRAFVDPETGKFRHPTPEELRSLSTRQPRVQAGEAPFGPARRKPDGTVLLAVPPERHSHLQATVTADGALRLWHGHD